MARHLSRSTADTLMYICTLAGGPFQIVFGAWLLNYAASASDLTDLFRNISLNLGDDGHFIGVTPPPTQDPTAFYEAENSARPYGPGLLKGRTTGQVEDGISVHMHGDTALGAVDFDCFPLRREIYENAARNAGLHGRLEWRLITSAPDGFQNGADRTSIDEIESYKTTPNYGLLIISKKG
jgi:toxoflavin synthase